VFKKPSQEVVLDMPHTGSDGIRLEKPGHVPGRDIVEEYVSNLRLEMGEYYRRLFVTKARIALL
jgi:hypothetical protein